MTAYYVMEPEVAGHWGDETDFTRTPGKPIEVQKLFYEFDGWLGDDIIESTPCYIVTSNLAANIVMYNLTGVNFDHVNVSKSDQFNELHPELELPEFVWMKTPGIPARDDFGLALDLRLVVSDRALAVLRNFQITHATFEPFRTNSEARTPPR